MMDIEKGNTRTFLALCVLAALIFSTSCASKIITDRPGSGDGSIHVKSVSRDGMAEYDSGNLVGSKNIDSLYRLLSENNHAELLSEAARLIRATHSPQYHAYIYECLSKASLKAEEVENALMFFVLAFENFDNAEKKRLIDQHIDFLANVEMEPFLVALSRVDKGKSQGELLYQLAKIKKESGKHSEARELLTKLLQLEPQSEKTASAREMLTRIDATTNMDTRHIGCLLPLSGPYQAYGEKALNGILHAVTEFNNANPSDPFRVTILDSESPDRSIDQMVAQLDEKRVAVIIGPLSHAHAAAAEAQKRHIPIIAMSQKEGICEVGEFVFRHFITANMQVEALLSAAVDNFGIRRFAVLYPKEPYGKKFAELFVSAAARRSVAVTNIESYEPDQTDFANQIRHMVVYNQNLSGGNDRSRSSNRKITAEASVDFEALFIPDSSKKISMIAPQLEYHDVNSILLLGTNLWHSDELIVQAGKYVQEAVVPDIFFGNSSADAVQLFVSGFESQFDDTPGFMEAIAYDTARIAFQSLSRPAIKSRVDVKLSLQNMDAHNGLTGRTVFAESGESHKNIYLLQIIGDRFVELRNSGPSHSNLSALPESLNYD